MAKGSQYTWSGCLFAKFWICWIYISLFANECVCLSSISSSINISVIEGDLNHLYQLKASDIEQTIVRYTVNSDLVDFWKTELRLEVEIVDKSFISSDCPLLMTVSQGKQVTSWDLPHSFKASSNSAEGLQVFYWAKTICVDPSAYSSNKTIQVVFVASTCSTTSIPFRLTATHHPTNPLLIPLTPKDTKDGENMLETNVSLASPKFYRFEFPKGQTDVHTVLIVLHSDANHCMTLSIQHPNCPVFDEETNVRYTGYWQTFTSKAGITIERKDFPAGFFLVMVVNRNNKGCDNKDGYEVQPRSISPGQGRISVTDRQKKVLFRIQPVLNHSQYVWPTLLPFIVYIPTLFGTLGLFVFFHRASVRNYTGGTMQMTLAKTNCPLRSEKYMCETRDELDTRKREKMEGKSRRYFYLLVTVALFYCVPVFQLIINYLGIVYRTGEQDICFYNNLCSLPLNQVMDFNHIYSNVGYVLFGLAFIFFVTLRQQLTSTDPTFRSNRNCMGLLPQLPRTFSQGTYEQYGLFYALGFALIMEGFLSASYHICPNKANFQFDTSFMYAMAVLSYVKVYQFRHSLYMSELMAFLLLAVVTASVVIGLFSTNVAYNIFLSVVHLLLVVGFQMYLVYINRRKKESDGSANTLSVLWELTKELVGFKTLFPYLMDNHPNKSLFWWTVGWNILLIINSWTLVYGTNFATQVLYILLANLTVYVIYYFIMKTIHLEFQGMFSKGFSTPVLQSLIYSILALLFMIPGMYYFMSPLSTWDVSPSASREMNEPCSLVGFYDNHDIWHLLSAPGLFFSFMVFLTIDDELVARHQENIPVF